MKSLYGYVGVSVSGTSLSEAEKELLAYPAVCTVVLFTRNIENPQQLEALVSNIRAVKKDMIIMIDCEGMDPYEKFQTRASVWRPLQPSGEANPYFDAPPPSQYSIAQSYHKNPEAGLAQAYQAGQRIAALCAPYRLLSLSVVLCSNPGNKAPYKNPVAQARQTVTGQSPGALSSQEATASSTQDTQLSQELSTDVSAKNPKVGWVIRGLGRSFGENPETIYTLAQQKLLGTREHGGLTHVKHAIDHGWAGEDTHVAASIDTRSKEDLMTHLEVYRKLADEGLVDTVMTSHVRFPALGDGEAEFGLSATGLDLLRKAMGEKPVFISDCLSMGAIAQSNILKSSDLTPEQCPQDISEEDFVKVKGMVEAIACASCPGKYQGAEGHHASNTDIVLACNLDVSMMKAILDNLSFVPDTGVLARVSSLQKWSKEDLTATSTAVSSLTP